MLSSKNILEGVQFRAVCEEGDFRGPWRNNEDQALEDAENHRNAGHQEHEIRVITKQTEGREQEHDDFFAPATSMLLDGIPAITPLPDIQKKVDAFHEKMNRIADFLIEYEAPEELQIKKEDLPIQFYIDKEAVARLMRICMQEDFVQLGVYWGLQNPANQDPLEPGSKIFGEITGCFIGLDKDRNILNCHFPHIPVGSTEIQKIDGEDTWPPPGGGDVIGGRKPENYFSLASEAITVHNFFNGKLGGDKDKKGIKKDE